MFMFHIILAAQTTLNSIYTGLIIAALVIIYLFERKLLQKEEEIKKYKVILIYLVSLVILLLGLFGILLIWKYDFQSYFSNAGFDIIDFIENSIGRIISSLITIFISLSLMKISKMSLKRVGTKPSPLQKRKKTIAKVTNSIIKYVVGVIMILVVLSIWGINVAPALAGLGILGLVIGLGAQKFINDLINGFFIIFEQHFDVGDIVEVDGFKGEVTDIGLKTTRIRNWKGEVKIVANGQITTLINYSRNPSVAIADFGIAYEEDVKKATEILNQELPKIRIDFPQIIEDPTVVGVIGLADSSVNMRVIAKTLNEQHYAVERALRQRIKEILNENDIEIPFPQIVINQK